MKTNFRNSRMAMRASLALAVAASLSIAAAPQPARAAVDIGISVNLAPPPLPVYEQPMIPAEGYIWTPGYWAYDPADGYYWVPGTWIRPPYHGALWTPGYWGWNSGVYVFNGGYWGSRVGYYGGINYGYGYGGHGYEGGYWRGSRFFYNRAANNINVNIHVTNVYNKTVVNNVGVNRFSFNGPGGSTARASSIEISYQKEKHTPPVADQVRQRDAARKDPTLRVSENKGNPPIAATERPGVIAKPTGTQPASAASNGNNDRTAGSGKLDNGNASGNVSAGNAQASGAAESRADQLKDKARVARSGNPAAAEGASASASAVSDAGDNTTPVKQAHKQALKNGRKVSGKSKRVSTSANANGAAMSQPMAGNPSSPPRRQHSKRQHANPSAGDSQQSMGSPQDRPVRSPRAGHGQDTGNAMQPARQARQPQEGKGEKKEEGKQKDKDHPPMG